MMLNDLTMFGEDGYVFNTPAYCTELLNAGLIFNSNVACGVLLNGYADIILPYVTGDETGAFDGLTTIAAVCGDSAALALLIASADAMDMVLSNDEAFETMIANAAACTAMRASATVIAAIEAKFVLYTVPALATLSGYNGVANGSENLADVYKAFDQITGNQWASTGTNLGWLQYCFDEPCWCLKYSQKNTSGTTVLPTSIKIQSSPDGSTWTDASSSILCGGVGAVTNAYIMGPVGKVRYWRWTVLANSGFYTALDSLQFYCVK